MIYQNTRKQKRKSVEHAVDMYIKTNLFGRDKRSAGNYLHNLQIQNINNFLALFWWNYLLADNIRWEGNRSEWRWCSPSIHCSCFRIPWAKGLFPLLGSPRKSSVKLLSFSSVLVHIIMLQYLAKRFTHIFTVRIRMQLMRMPDKIDVISWDTKAFYGPLPVFLNQVQKSLISGHSFLKKDIIVKMRSGYLIWKSNKIINKKTNKVPNTNLKNNICQSN